MNGTRQISVAGGNLFRIAAEQLGSATQWYRIILANPGLAPDPWLDSSVTTLTVPRRDLAVGNGGILGAR